MEMQTILTGVALSVIGQILLIYVAKWVFDVKEIRENQKANAELLAKIAEKLGVTAEETKALLSKIK